MPNIEREKQNRKWKWVNNPFSFLVKSRVVPHF